jgi:hypothetical protein
MAPIRPSLMTRAFRTVLHPPARPDTDKLPDVWQILYIHCALQCVRRCTASKGCRSAYAFYDSVCLKRRVVMRCTSTTSKIAPMIATISSPISPNWVRLNRAKKPTT